MDQKLLPLCLLLAGCGSSNPDTQVDATRQTTTVRTISVLGEPMAGVSVGFFDETGATIQTSHTDANGELVVDDVLGSTATVVTGNNEMWSVTDVAADTYTFVVDDITLPRFELAVDASGAANTAVSWRVYTLCDEQISNNETTTLDFTPFCIADPKMPYVVIAVDSNYDVVGYAYGQYDILNSTGTLDNLTWHTDAMKETPTLSNFDSGLVSFTSVFKIGDALVPGPSEGFVLSIETPFLWRLPQLEQQLVRVEYGGSAEYRSSRSYLLLEQTFAADAQDFYFSHENAGTYTKANRTLSVDSPYQDATLAIRYDFTSGFEEYHWNIVTHVESLSSFTVLAVPPLGLPAPLPEGSGVSSVRAYRTDASTPTLLTTLSGKKIVASSPLSQPLDQSSLLPIWQ